MFLDLHQFALRYFGRPGARRVWVVDLFAYHRFSCCVSCLPGAEYPALLEFPLPVGSLPPTWDFHVSLRFSLMLEERNPLLPKIQRQFTASVVFGISPLLCHPVIPYWMDTGECMLTPPCQGSIFFPAFWNCPYCPAPRLTRPALPQIAVSRLTFPQWVERISPFPPEALAADFGGLSRLLERGVQLSSRQEDYLF